MPTHRSAASAINLLDEVNEQAPWPVKAMGVPGKAMDDVMLRVIASVEQTLGGRPFSAMNQERQLSAERLQLDAQHDRWCPAAQDRRVRANRLWLAAQRDRWSATDQEAQRAA